ncbi:MAG: sulfotransferase family 2 domain-containing protein [Planctomycetota bacterium]|nr:sulfotransferase family 2 domain-containing protein [Planctomycetota bacterium]
MLILSEKYQVGFVGAPKCATTTMVDLMLSWHGFEGIKNPRGFMKHNSERLQEAGLFIHDTGKPKVLLSAYREHDAFFWFTAVRSPVSRTLSNYRNKLSRYAKRFEYRSYLGGKLLQLARGPRSWADANSASECIAKFISFPQFVDGLTTHGVGFDSHYRTFSKILQMDRIQYDAVLQLESMEEDIVMLQKKMAASGVDTEHFPKLGRLNSTSRSEEGLSAELREKIALLYDVDSKLIDRINSKSIESPGVARMTDT